MYSIQSPDFPRKLSYGSLLNLYEKCEGHNSAFRPKVAIIGAGITGISTACHVLDAGYDCHIFEAGTRESIGGIWQKVNKTSQLQIHSKFYRFHPAVEWKSDYPNRQEILGQVAKLWNIYGLEARSTFCCPVTSTTQEEDGKWVLNDPANGYFDGIVAAVGTCADVYAPTIAGQDRFEGQIIHSSQLNRKTVEGKKVLIIGGGASAVEALEFASDNGAASVKVLSRSEKWFIPRNPTLNMALAGTIGDRFGILGWILEFMIRHLFYREFWDMAPPSNGSNGLYDGTPIVNSRIFELMRKGRAKWIRADVSHFTKNGIHFLKRKSNDPKGTIGEPATVQGDLCILATGYTRPSLSFLPKLASTGTYRPPNWYLQTFPTENATICATNCTWKDGIGSVGGCHIGIYTRFLLVFLLDSQTRPSTRMMQAWVDLVHVLKKPYVGGALSFVTSAELFLWFLVVILLQPALWRWTSFILIGPDTLASMKPGVEEAAGNSSLCIAAEPKDLVPLRQDSGVALNQLQ